MSCGYDVINDRIWILGGVPDSTQLVSYETNGSFIDHGESVLSRTTWGWGQYFTVIVGSLWMLAPSGTSINRFNFETKNFTSDYARPQQDVEYYGCLASWMDTKMNPILIVNGGWNSNDGRLNTTQIYNMTSGEWTISPSVPLMANKRDSPACIVIGNVLYSIGGRSELVLDSVEMLNVESMIPWITLNDTLTKRLFTHRAVLYHQDILIIGGYSYIGGNGENDEINVINTVTNTITSGGTLDFAVRWPCPVSKYPLDNLIFAFGGWPHSQITNLWQYTTATTAPTTPPTMDTAQPSVLPTVGPTSTYPTTPPTMDTAQPSVLPTVGPTSTYPTTPPTMDTAQPSVLPTVGPTSTYPTIQSSDPPTKSPNVFFYGNITSTNISEDKVGANNNDIMLAIIIVIVVGLIIIVVGLAYCYRVRMHKQTQIEIKKIEMKRIQYESVKNQSHLKLNDDHDSQNADHDALKKDKYETEGNQEGNDGPQHTVYIDR
eukprot:528368_1